MPEFALMSDERLAEIEANYLSGSSYDPRLAGTQIWELLVEVHRLKRALKLSQLPRGVPSQYEQIRAAAAHTGIMSPGLLGQD